MLYTFYAQTDDLELHQTYWGELMEAIRKTPAPDLVGIPRNSEIHQCVNVFERKFQDFDKVSKLYRNRGDAINYDHVIGTLLGGMHEGYSFLDIRELSITNRSKFTAWLMNQIQFLTLTRTYVKTYLNRIGTDDRMRTVYMQFIDPEIDKWVTSISKMYLEAVQKTNPYSFR